MEKHSSTRTLTLLIQTPCSNNYTDPEDIRSKAVTPICRLLPGMFAHVGSMACGVCVCVCLCVCMWAAVPRVVDVQQHPIMALAFSKSGDSLTAGYTDGTVQVWNGESRTVSPLHVRKGFQVTLVVFRYTQEVAWSTQCFPVYTMFPSLLVLSVGLCTTAMHCSTYAALVSSLMPDRVG